MSQTTLRLHAAHAVQRAIRRGELPRLSERDVLCVDCGQRRAIHYEHRDYHVPLAVDPVCQSCNLRRGRGLGDCEEYRPRRCRCGDCGAVWVPRVAQPLRCPRCGAKR